ncbi:G2/mitotic-specific cyclin cdc13 [Dissophora ornata]|nr:G2/mitotic-specific cyclin cdc13 [Dissophora ornata]
MSQQPISRSRAPLMSGKRAQNNENIAAAQPTITYVKDVLSSMQPSKQQANNANNALKKRVLGEKTNSGASSDSKENINLNGAKSYVGKARAPAMVIKRERGLAPAPTPVQAQAPVQHQARRVLQEKLFNHQEHPAVVKKETGFVFKMETGIKKEAGVAVKKEPGVAIKKEPGVAVKREPGLAVKREPGVVVKKEPGVAVKREPGVAVKMEPGVAVKMEPGVAVKMEADVTIKKEIVVKLEAEHIPMASVKSIVKRELFATTTDASLSLLEGEEETRAYEEEMNRKRPKREEYVPWDDYEAEEANDPLMVSEYSTQIFEYMQELEASSMPDPNYIRVQKGLAWKMRSVLNDWLAEVHHKFKLLPETLFLSVNLVDRFLSVRSVSMTKLQLVGATAMFIASKYEEVIAPSIQNFIYMSDGGFDDEEILDAERYMLQALDYKILYPSPMNFLRRISKADNYDIHSRTVAKYLMEIPLLDFAFLECPPSMISAAALCLARRMMGRDKWHTALVVYSGYTEEDLMPCMERMVFYIQQPKKVNTFIYTKYASKRFLKASVFVQECVRNWARVARQERSRAT